MFALKRYLRKYGTYLLGKLRKLRGTPYSVAAGFACGAAISFTPLIGFHTVLALLTALIVRGNLIAAAVGTIVGNPWTFPFIWAAILYTGHFLLGTAGSAESVNFIRLFQALSSSLLHLDFKNFGREVWPFFYPMLVGCLPYYVASWFISYILVRKTLDKQLERRQARLAMKEKEHDNRTGM